MVLYVMIMLGLLTFLFIILCLAPFLTEVPTENPFETMKHDEEEDGPIEDGNFSLIGVFRHG